MRLVISDVPDLHKDNAKYDYQVLLSIGDIRRIVRVLEDRKVLRPMASFAVEVPKQVQLHCNACHKTHRAAAWFTRVGKVYREYVCGLEFRKASDNVVHLVARRRGRDYVIDGHLADRSGVRWVSIIRTGNLA